MYLLDVDYDPLTVKQKFSRVEIMAEELDKPLLDPENFNREGIDLVSYATMSIV